MVKYECLVRSRLFLVIMLGWVCAWIGSAGSVFAASSSVPRELQSAYDGKQYQRVIDEMVKLSPEQRAVPDVRRIAIRSLLKLGNPKDALMEYDQLEATLKREDPALLHDVALGFVVVLLKDMREQMRGAAYTALKELESPETIPFLEDGLGDGSGLVRALAAEGLAKLEEGRRSARFKKALDDQAALVKEAVLKGLGRSGEPSVVALVEPALKDPEARVRVAAAEALCRLGRGNGCDLLLQSGRALNPDEQTSAIRALLDLQRPQTLRILIEASENKQPSVRGAAAAGLARAGGQEALPALARLLKDPLPPVRISAAVSLGQIHSKESVAVLKNALQDHDASVEAFVVGALLELGERYDSVASSIANLSNAKEPAVRAAVARALSHASEANQEAARSALLVLVEDAVPRVRIATLKSLTKFSSTQSLPLLKQGLKDEDEAVRATAGGGVIHLLEKKKRQNF